MDSAKVFRIKETADKSAVLSIVGPPFHWSSSRTQNPEMSLIDTFDWRVTNKRHMLLFSGNTHLILQDLASKRETGWIALSLSCLPRFWWDIPDSELQRRIRKIIGVRALLRIIDFEMDSNTIHVLNQDEKTVARIAFHRMIGFDTKGTKRVMEYMELNRLKGYDHEFNTICDRIKPLRLPVIRQNTVFEFARDFGIEPGKDPSKINVSLDPNEPCGPAMKKVLIQMLLVMKRNENGIKTDIDTEFLHDTRVAIRRTSSVLGEMKGVFPQDLSDRFKGHFKTLIRSSNRLRDIDVVLLQRNELLSMLPADLQPGLLPLFKTLLRERQQALEKAVKAMNCEGTKKFLAAWELFLHREEDAEKTAVNAVRPVLDVTEECILKHHGKVLKFGKGIDESTTDENLHRLRIQCKKLRYLLEFFSGLFSEEEVKSVVKLLKTLQDHLGEFHDLSVQQEELKTCLNRIPANRKTVKTEAAALGGLISLHRQRKIDIRLRFKAVFADFAGKENTGRIQRLFKRTPGAGT